ncbi:MAG TPA: fused MFS/spermidine synthase [Pyrinomonadaceae bacterium]|nr:fused MFS/spermidine synthase [Pyrinomonadaceae bacterium]
MTANGASILTPAKNYSPRTLRLVAVCFLLSGATGLIYEVLWARMLGLVFGVTTLAISAVLAAFMGGLALGSALAARFAPRINRPVRVYALIEIVIGVYALAVPLLFRWVDRVYAEVWAGAWQNLHPGFYGSALSRFVLASVVLIIPTTLMGATLPILAKAVKASTRRTISVTSLYTLNLVGAIAGTIAAGFVLLPTVGVSLTIWIAALINLFIGLGALLLEARDRGFANLESEAVEEPFDPPASDNVATSSVFWLFCAVTSGFVTISMQVVWSRLLAMIIGSSTYAFSIVLALFLTGLSLGAYFVSGRKSPDTRALRRMIFVVEVLTAVSLFVSIRIANAAPALLVNAGFRLGINSWTGLLTLQIVVVALLILIPAVLMGMVMPMVLKWAEQSTPASLSEVHAGAASSTSRLVGLSYATNTLGAIAGSVATAFLLIPGTTTRFTIFCITSLCLVVAGIAYQPRRPVSDRALVRSLAIGATAVLVIATFVVWPRLNLNALSAGAYDGYVRVLAKARGDVPEEVGNDRPENHQLLMFQEGRTATVSVRRDWGITSVAINGRTNASDGADMPTQVMLGQLGVLTAPRLNNALIVGFATGVTAGSVLRWPMNSVDCVEIEPAAVASSRYFEHVNNKPLADPRLHIILDDARTYLRTNPARYDIIISEPSHPWVPGVANLFTSEFFSLGKERLRDDGVFVQWLQMYQLSTESLRSVLATFHEVFPHVLVFRVRGDTKGKDLILLGSRQPLNLDHVAERISNPRVAADLARVGIRNIEDVRGWFVTDETQLGPAVAGAVINTDDNMHVETVAPREAFRATMEENSAWIEKLRSKAPN